MLGKTAESTKGNFQKIGSRATVSIHRPMAECTKASGRVACSMGSLSIKRARKVKERVKFKVDLAFGQRASVSSGSLLIEQGQS